MLKRTLREFKEDNTTDWAAALTYYGVLSLFPALIAMVSIVGLVFNPQEVTRALTEIVSTISPGTAAETLKGPIEGITSSKGQSGVFAVVGVLLALSSASGYVGAFMRAANQMFEVDEGREFYKLRPLQMAVTLAMILLAAIAALSVVLTGPIAEAVGNAVGLGSTFVDVWDYAKWPFLIGIVLLILSLLYYAAPNAKIPTFKFVTAGSLLAVAVWLVASVAFAFYVANFGSYDKTYGTLGGVVAFLVWFWITNIAFLLGLQFNAERERSRQIQAGVPGAERELQLPERDEAKPKQRPHTA